MAEEDDQKQIQVGTYARTIQARAVTFTCAHCGQKATIQQYPGYPPRYCSADCKRAVHRVRDHERKARQRTAARAAESSAVSDPLPQLLDTIPLLEPAPLPPSSSDSPPIVSDKDLELGVMMSDSLDRPSDSTVPPPLSDTHPRMADVVTVFPPPGIPSPAAVAALATDDTAGDSHWEGEEEAWDEKDWAENEEDDLDDPIYSLQSVRLRPGQKRHLATELRETFCGREFGYQLKELRGFDSRDCQSCHEKARALHFCCADCDKPLLRRELSGRCRTCQARYEKLGIYPSGPD